MKKAATYALVALVVWWAVENPTAAAHLIHNISGFINQAGRAFSAIANATN